MLVVLDEDAVLDAVDEESAELDDPFDPFDVELLDPAGVLALDPERESVA